MGKQKGCKDFSLNGLSLVKLAAFSGTVVPSKCFVINILYISEETGFYFCEYPT